MTEDPGTSPGNEAASGPAEGTDNSIVVAIFPKRSETVDALVNEGVVAANVEQVAHAAVVVAKQEDGSFRVTHSEHNVGRSLAALTAKLMIVLPLGFHGLIAAGVAGTQVAAATRDRPDADVTDQDLGFLVDRMEPGQSAVLASYPTEKVGAATKAFGTLGAITVWHAPEGTIRAAATERGVAAASES